MVANKSNGQVHLTDYNWLITEQVQYNIHKLYKPVLMIVMGCHSRKETYLKVERTSNLGKTH